MSFTMGDRTERLPLVTLSLIGVNTLVWLVTLICHFNTGGDSDLWISDHLWLIPNQAFIWTYLTSMFVHAGFFHLLGKMIFLFLSGGGVEDIIGRLRFAIFIWSADWWRNWFMSPCRRCISCPRCRWVVPRSRSCAAWACI